MTDTQRFAVGVALHNARLELRKADYATEYQDRTTVLLRGLLVLAMNLVDIVLLGNDATAV